MNEHSYPVGTAGVRAEGLSKTFHTHAGNVLAVDDLDLSIAPGETVALLGPNGAGKSTTIDMLLGLTRPDSGTVQLFGQPPEQAIRAGAVGGMLQVGELLRDLTVRELIDMMASLYPAPLSVSEVLSLTGLTDIADRSTQKLSGGQTQRVRFAITLVGNPDVMFLDEPTVALDVEARREFWDIMRGFTRSGRTVIFATHYLEEADAYADRVILMARGRIVADGPATELKAKVGGRIIRATLPDADPTALGALPGVTSADVRGDAVVLNCVDSDLALRALLPNYPAARDVEVAGASLEEAFMQLTGEDRVGSGGRR